MATERCQRAVRTSTAGAVRRRRHAATTVVAETLTSTDSQRPLRPPFTTMAAVAEHSGAIAVGDGEAWLGQLTAAGQRGRFFWALTMFAVGATRA